MLAGVDQRRPLVVDQELIEGDAVRVGHRRDAVDPADDVVDAGLHDALPPFRYTKLFSDISTLPPHVKFDDTPMCNDLMVARKYELRRRAEPQRGDPAANRRRRDRVAPGEGAARTTPERRWPAARASSGTRSTAISRTSGSSGSPARARSWERNPPPDPESWRRNRRRGGTAAPRAGGPLRVLRARRGDDRVRAPRCARSTRSPERSWSCGAAGRRRIREVLATGLPRRRRVQAAWISPSTSTRGGVLPESGLSRREAVETMVAAVLGQ